MTGRVQSVKNIKHRKPTPVWWGAPSQVGHREPSR